MRRYKNIKSVLNHAANLIEKSGWCRYIEKEKIDGKMHYCALGAIKKFSYHHTLTEKAVNVVEKKLREEKLLFSEWRDITDWNDESFRKKSEVISALRKTANSL